MRVRALLVLASLLLVAGLARAADPVTSLRGKLVDPVTGAAVGGAAVKLTRVSDTTQVHRGTSADDGTFKLAGLAIGSYRLEATRLGYAALRMVVRATRDRQDLGVLQMVTEAVKIGGITVSESPAPAIQKADTTEFRAGAVKTHKDATAEELVQKLPGVTVEGGQVRAQGEAVQQVLVNGRPFMGSDPTAAMRNLPAEVVDRIQVYDRASDQAEFSGFDDGQSQKTMNFILRDQKATFGKAYAGYGDEDRYQTGGNVTWLRGATRLSLLGMSNNINQRNFSPQDLFGALSGGAGGGGPRMMMMGGGGMRPPGGGGGMQVIRMGGGFGGGGGFDPSSFFVNPQGGVSTTHSGGLNLVGQRGPKLSFSSSVFLNDTDTDNLQSLSRQFVPPQDSVAFYDQAVTSDVRNGNQRFEGRLEWTPDSLNSVILQPRLFFQNTRNASLGSGSNTSTLGSTLNSAANESASETGGDNLSSRLTLRHRFAKRGRNVSAEINAGHTGRDGEAAQISLTETHEGTTTVADTLDQRSKSEAATNSFSTRVAFTEPLVPGVQAQLFYAPALTRSTADARAFEFDPATGAYAIPDSAASNSYESWNVVHNGGLSLLFTRGPWKLLTTAAGQWSELESEQSYPETRTIRRTFEDVLPSLTLTGSFANRRNLRVNWRTSTIAPTISQLQNVVDRSNPLSLASGNPDLRQTYNHTLMLRLSEADPSRSTSRFLFGNVTRTSHPIANATFVAPSDTTVNGVFLTKGTQLTTPANLDESWNANLFAVYSRPTPWLKSIVSLHGGGSYSRTPSRGNAGINRASNTGVRSGLTLSSNISARLDFTVSYMGSWNFARNTLSTDNSGDYYSHFASVRLNTVMGPGIVMRQEMTHNLQSGVADAYAQDVVLWNTTLGKKFLKNERGEFRVTATDVLGRERSVNRSLTDNYVQDTRDRVLGRFVQAVFTYTFR